MTTRPLEECFELESIEEEEHSRWIRILIPEGATAVLVDPYIINMQGLENAKPGVTSLIRIRRPGWGRGDMHKYIKVLK